MSKKIITLAIATAIIILCFIGCSNTTSPAETTASTTAVIYTAPRTTSFFDTFDKTFVSEEAERVFTVIREEKQDTYEGFAIITDYLRNTSPEKVVDEFNSANNELLWQLGENCTLIVGSSRSLELVNSEEKIKVLTNIDTLLVDETPDYLNDWNYGQKGFQNSWRVSDMTFYSGYFYSLGKIIFDATPPLGSEDEKTTLVGSITSSDGTTYIVAKHNSKIVLIEEKNHEFRYEVIANDAVSAPEEISFPRSDRYMSDTNYDALMLGRTILYRNEYNKLVQLDITDNGVKSFILVDDFREYNLLYDYSGVYWLRTTDLAEKSLEELLYLNKYPDHFISRDGDITEYYPSGN
ncbi:MAG: hypothetical protein E7310_06670 [Clostridiales bacterium]|nr:hypothetical protein [Clostridiales bacterium]